MKQNYWRNETGTGVTIKHENISWICIVVKITLYCPTKISFPAKTREKETAKLQKQLEALKRNKIITTYQGQ
jgi:hypothetical protein